MEQEKQHLPSLLVCHRSILLRCSSPCELEVPSRIAWQNDEVEKSQVDSNERKPGSTSPEAAPTPKPSRPPNLLLVVPSQLISIFDFRHGDEEN